MEKKISMKEEVFEAGGSHRCRHGDDGFSFQKYAGRLGFRDHPQEQMPYRITRRCRRFAHGPAKRAAPIMSWSALTPPPVLNER